MLYPHKACCHFLCLQSKAVWRLLLSVAAVALSPRPQFPWGGRCDRAWAWPWAPPVLTHTRRLEACPVSAQLCPAVPALRLTPLAR